VDKTFPLRIFGVDLSAQAKGLERRVYSHIPSEGGQRNQPSVKPLMQI